MSWLTEDLRPLAEAAFGLVDPKQVANPTRQQAGSVHFALYRRTDDPSTIVGFERWAAASDHQRHLQGAHVQKLMSALGDILAEPPQIVSYEVIDE